MEVKKESPDSFSQNGQGSTSIKQVKDTENSLNNNPEVTDCYDSYSDKLGSKKRDLTAYAENNFLTVTNSIICFLEQLEHTAQIVSQSPRVLIYQIKLFDLIPRTEINAIWIPIPKLEGVEADILVVIRGEWVKLHVSFNPGICSHQNHQNGRFDLEVRSFEEFLQWYNSTFEEVKP